MDPVNPKRQDDAITRAAARLRGAKPELDKLIVRATPVAKIAGRAALRYVREHEGEIKQAGATFARARFRGPLRLVAEAIVKGASPSGAATKSQEQTQRLCQACGTANPAAARFCNACGQRLITERE